MFLIFLLFGLPSILLSLDFIYFFIFGKRWYNEIYNFLLDIITLIVLPFFYLNVIDEKINNCCSDSASFSPDHKFTIYFLIVIFVLNYFYSQYRKNISSPIVEVLSNCLILMGFLFNIFISIQVGIGYFLFGNLPICILFLLRLLENHKIFLNNNQQFDLENIRNANEKMAWKILNYKFLRKMSILLVLSIPILVTISSLLLLFGQKPDSIIRAFTDTYKHGFSQLNYLCDNVNCGSHFLCSVAANGHKNIVKPTRYGVRNGGKIICNRQLLVSNAFEDLLQEKFPIFHQIIRKHYNKVGNYIHRHYHVFNNKYFADLIYFMMKPLELLFVFIIYLSDKKPENRISKQYLKKIDRDFLKNC